jgi:hypothetical protein
MKGNTVVVESHIYFNDMLLYIVSSIAFVTLDASSYPIHHEDIMLPDK